MPTYWKPEMCPSLKNKNKKKLKTNSANDPACFPPRNTPKQQSFFLHKAVRLLYFLHHLPRCPNQVPGTILNSSSSLNPHHQSTTKSHWSQAPPRSIALPDALSGAVSPPLPTQGQPLVLLSSRLPHTPLCVLRLLQGLWPLSLCTLPVSPSSHCLWDEEEF